MKLLIVLIIPTICSSQDLTRLKTRRQVEKLITESFMFDDEYKYESFTIDSTNSSYDNFREGDFNHDGIKDLLVLGTAQFVVKKWAFKQREIVIIMADKDSLRKVRFPYGFFSDYNNVTPYPKVINIGQEDFISIGYEMNVPHQKSKVFYDTLYVVNDCLMTFTEHPSKREMSRIDFKTSHCFGTCPVFEMSIDKNLEVEYNGIDHVNKKGQFKLKAQEKDWDYLTRLISNLRIEDLKNSYSINATDHQTVFLKVHFGEGKEKSIRDYGLRGTFGLSILYDYFFELIEF